MIARLYIHNFRCLENFTLDLADRPSALLIGGNGSGKSTVLQGLRLLQGIGRGAGRVGGLIAAGDFAQHRSHLPMRFAADVVLSGRQFTYDVSFDWPAAFREARVLEEGLAVDGKPVFRRKLAQVQVEDGTPFRLDPHVFGLPVIDEPPGERAIQDIRAFFADTILIAPIPANMSGFSEEASSQMRPDASNFASCLRALLGRKPEAYAAFESYIRDVIPDFSSIENVERGEAGNQLIVKFDDGGDRGGLAVEYKALSDGEKCFFLSAYIVAANRVGGPVSCFWDEPDNHLSISEVGRLVTGLRKMANRGGQFIATTHHPETVRRFSDETTLVLSRRSHLEPTTVRPLSEIPYDGDLINALIREEIAG